MKRRQLLPGLLAMPLSLGVEAWAEDSPSIRIVLDAKDPSQSRLYLDAENEAGMPVGFGRDGFLEAGSVFRGGYSLLGNFRVNAILSAEHFEMTPELIEQSGKSRAWLQENLFSNMSSIDFDGDGKGGEYGAYFIGLEPTKSTAKQPFHFGEYKGVFRWYSYAIHGTQDQSRIGKCVTGGCINVGRDELSILVENIQIGDRVSVQA